MKKTILILCLLFAYTCLHAQCTNMQIEAGVSPKNDIISICFDRQNNMWVATSYGIYKQEAEKWNYQGMENIYVKSFHIDANNTKWAGVWGAGLYTCPENGKWELAEAAKVSMAANAIISAEKNKVWAGTWSGGLAAFDGKKWQTYTAQNAALGDNSVLSLAYDNNHNLWVGTYHGLSLFDGKAWTLYNKSNSPLPDNDIYSLAAGSDNNLWIGTCKGLAKLNNGEWIVYQNKDLGIPSNIILALAEDASGNLWIGTNKGLTVFDGKNKKTFTMENSNLIEDRIQTITIHNNKIYLGTSLGISILDISQLKYE